MAPVTGSPPVTNDNDSRASVHQIDRRTSSWPGDWIPRLRGDCDVNDYINDFISRRAIDEGPAAEAYASIRGHPERFRIPFPWRQWLLLCQYIVDVHNIEVGDIVTEIGYLETRDYATPDSDQ